MAYLGYKRRETWTWGRDVVVSRAATQYNVDTGFAPAWEGSIVIIGFALPPKTRMCILVDGDPRVQASGAALAALNVINRLQNALLLQLADEGMKVDLTKLIDKPQPFLLVKPCIVAAGQRCSVTVEAEPPHEADAGPIGLYGVVTWLAESP